MSFRSLGVAVTLLASYAVGLRCMIASDATMAILSSGGHFPAWAILATLTVLLLRVVVIVVLPAVLFAKLGGAAFDAWPLSSSLRAASSRRRSSRRRFSQVRPGRERAPALPR